MKFINSRFYIPTIHSGPATPAFVGALDEFPPDFAWSHRRALVSSFDGNIMQARRMSDDEPYNVVRLANGEGDIAGLQSFVGSGSAALPALTEQMGSGVDFIQPTADYQRIIIDSGSLVTVGGKAASRGLRPSDAPFTPIGGGMTASLGASFTGSTFSLFIRYARTAYTGLFTSILDMLFSATSGANYPTTTAGAFGTFHAPSDPTGGVTLGTNYSAKASGDVGTDTLLSIIFDGANVTLRNGTDTYSGSYTDAFNFDTFLLCLFQDGTQDYSSLNTRVQEMAVWLSDQTANEPAIRSALMA